MAGHTDNEIVINAPLDFVWRRMNDVESWPSLFSEYASADIVERTDDRTFNFRLTTHPDPEFNNQVWSWVSRRMEIPENYATMSQRVETGPFEYMYINWYFSEADGGTKMRWIQDFHMKPGMPNDDPKQEDYLNRNTKIQMQTIKQRLEEEASKQ
jgi:aromatase